MTVVGAALLIEIDTSLSTKHIIRTLYELFFDNENQVLIIQPTAPGFTWKDLELWAKDNEIQLQFIQSGRPVQNVFIEHLKRICRESIHELTFSSNFIKFHDSPQSGWKNTIQEEFIVTSNTNTK